MLMISEENSKLRNGFDELFYDVSPRLLLNLTTQYFFFFFLPPARYFSFAIFSGSGRRTSVVIPVTFGV